MLRRRTKSVFEQRRVLAATLVDQHPGAATTGANIGGTRLVDWHLVRASRVTPARAASPCQASRSALARCETRCTNASTRSDASSARVAADITSWAPSSCSGT